MGGVGSGRQRSTLDNHRQTTDQFGTVDIRSLKRKGLITPGLEWIGGGPYDAPWLALEWTPCNFGGERPWFICPGEGCGRRVAILYGPTLPLLCRQCRGLVYASQQPQGSHRGAATR